MANLNFIFLVIPLYKYVKCFNFFHLRLNNYFYLLLDFHLLIMEYHSINAIILIPLIHFILYQSLFIHFIN
jgi:hypothetical protein